MTPSLRRVRKLHVRKQLEKISIPLARPVALLCLDRRPVVNIDSISISHVIHDQGSD